jgi:hypothetical protein
VFIIHLWELKTVVFMHRCLISAVLLYKKYGVKKFNIKTLTVMGSGKNYCSLFYRKTTWVGSFLVSIASSQEERERGENVTYCRHHRNKLVRLVQKNILDRYSIRGISATTTPYGVDS